MFWVTPVNGGKDLVSPPALLPPLKRGPILGPISSGLAKRRKRRSILAPLAAKSGAASSEFCPDVFNSLYHAGGVQGANQAMIDDYSFGRITVDGKTHTSDVIIYPDRVDAAWWRKQGHRLCVDDLQDAVAAEPETLVVGTGTYGLMRVPADVRDHLAELGVELKVAKTGEACQLYNQLAAQKKTIAALHLTC